MCSSLDVSRSLDIIFATVYTNHDEGILSNKHAVVCLPVFRTTLQASHNHIAVAQRASVFMFIALYAPNVLDALLFGTPCNHGAPAAPRPRALAAAICTTADGSTLLYCTLEGPRKTSPR